MRQEEFVNCFSSYQNMAHMLKTCEYKEILEMAAAMTDAAPAAVEQYPVGYFEETVIGTYRSVLQDLQKNIAQYDWLYDRLADDASQEVLTQLTGYRIFPVPLFLEAARDAVLPDLAEDIWRDAALPIDLAESISGCSRTMLLKNKEYIQKEAPGLALCLHYYVDDIWEAPKLVDAIRPDYRFFLRFHPSGSNGGVMLYALPRTQERRTERSGEIPKRIAAISPGAGWSNAQLVKDCGVIPYLLCRDHSCDASMVGAKQDEYVNLRYLQGLKMEFLPDGTIQGKADYVLKEAGKIDGLLLYGAYAEYAPLAALYKQKNPAGKIYLALDANSFWMDRIRWTEPNFLSLLSQCDVIGASGRAMQRHLNEKWPWEIEYIPNGFYNFAGADLSFSFEKKKNVILTAGRLGTEQKATHILLEAFASIAEEISDWNLHLAGTVEEGWKENYLKGFWEKYPELKERIFFLGHISDKQELYLEYRTAKIFALSSQYEGGCPNVIAEALFAGDTIAITRIDEYRDAIDGGSCGLAADVGDVERFAEILLRLCRQENLEKMCRRAHEYAREAFDMERIVDRLYYLLFGEDITPADTVLPKSAPADIASAPSLSADIVLAESVPTDIASLDPALLNSASMDITEKAAVYTEGGSSRVLLDFTKYLTNKSRIPMHREPGKDILTLPELLAGLFQKEKATYGESLCLPTLLLDTLLTARLIQTSQPVHVLEYGSGNGRLSWHMAELLGRCHPESSLVCAYHAMDETWVEWMERVYQALQLPKVSFLSGEYGHLQLQKNHFDIVLINGMENFTEPEQVILDALSLASEDGILLCYAQDAPLLEDIFKLYFEGCNEYNLASSQKVLMAGVKNQSWNPMPDVEVWAQEDLREAELCMEERDSMHTGGNQRCTEENTDCMKEKPDCTEAHPPHVRLADLIARLDRDARAAAKAGKTDLKLSLIEAKENMVDLLLAECVD